MSKKGGDDTAAQLAQQARADEQARQARIRNGTARINALFDGTPIPTNGSSNPLGGIFSKAGSALNDKFGQIPGFGRLGGGLSEALSKFGGLFGGNKNANDPLAGNTFKGFNDDFYKGIRQSYLDYATPQLEDQLADARKQLTFALDRSHLLDSSARAEKQGELEKTAGTARQGIADTGLTYEQNTRNAVEGARADLINQLNTTGDDQMAVNNALSRVQALSAPQQFSPLSGLFANFTAGLGAQAAAERAQYYSQGQIRAPFNTGLFTPSGSSVKLTP